MTAELFSQQYSDLLGTSSDSGDHAGEFYFVSFGVSVFLPLQSVLPAEDRNNSQGPRAAAHLIQYPLSKGS